MTSRKVFRYIQRLTSKEFLVTHSEIRDRRARGRQLPGYGSRWDAKVHLARVPATLAARRTNTRARMSCRRSNVLASGRANIVIYFFSQQQRAQMNTKGNEPAMCPRPAWACMVLMRVKTSTYTYPTAHLRSILSKNGVQTKVAQTKL